MLNSAEHNYCLPRSRATHNHSSEHFRFWILLLLQLLVAPGSVISDIPKRTQMEANAFLFRPYSSETDEESLNDMCKDVWGGNDYLPGRVAQSFEDDADCEFAVLQDNASGELVAAGNLRTMDPPHGKSYWIEAIRVAPAMEGRGVCTLLMRELCKRARDRGAQEILSCTIDSNPAMKAVFGKMDMAPVSGFRFPDFGKLRQLKGWAASDEASPQTILKALELEETVDEQARRGIWDPITTYEDLQTVLEPLRCRNHTTGHLPAVTNLLSLTDDLRVSLESGLVRKLRKSNNRDHLPAVFAFVKGPTFGLKSKYTCSIVALTSEDFDAAVWEACRPHYLPLLEDHLPSFMCMFEMPHPHPIPNSIQESLPMQMDKVFIYYRWTTTTTTSTHAETDDP